MTTKKSKTSKTSKEWVVAKKAASTVLTINRHPSVSADAALREQVLRLLSGGEAHADFDSAIGDWPVQLAGAKVPNFPHTAWMLLEHMRIAQWDILEFSRNPKHVSPNWPEGYWPTSEAPADEKAWTTAIAEFKKDMRAMEQLVANRKSDLCENFHGEMDRHSCAKLCSSPTTTPIIWGSWSCCASPWGSEEPRRGFLFCPTASLRALRTLDASPRSRA